MRSKTTPERKAAARSLRDDGLSYQAIADRMGVSEITARRWCDVRLDGEGGICACGCGGRTKIAKVTGASAKLGEPYAYIAGHQHRHYDGDYVVNDNGCWVWQRGMLGDTGYGAISRDGYKGVAHRWYYERHIGPIPGGLELDHLCRNRACVNPAHLEPVTREENIRRGAGTKLTRVQVAEIRASGEKPMVLAKRYGVTGTQIRTILLNRQWVLPGAQPITHSRKKLTEADVAEIHRLAAGGLSRAETGRRFDVAASHVSNIVNGKARAVNAERRH